MVTLSLVCDADDWLLALGQECLAALLLPISILRHEQFQLISFSIWQSSRLLVDLGLQAADRELEQLVLPLGLQDLLVQEVALLLQVVRLALLLLDLLGLLVLFLLHPDLVVPDTLYRLL